MKVEDLILTELLDTPSLFSKIYLSTKQGSSTKYITVKFDKKTKSDKKFIKNIFNNYIYALKNTNHPNIVKLIDVKETFDANYLVLEYFNGGNLEDFAQKYFEEKKMPLTEEIVQYIMRQLINTLKYLHQKKIIFRDIKPSNLLINYENEEDRKNKNIMKGKIKLADFSLSTHLKKGETESTWGGSVNFMPPEIIIEKDGEIKSDEKIDIWSLGITFYKLLTGNFPFISSDFAELKEKFNKGDYIVPITLSREAISFLNCMLKYEPDKRYSCEQLSMHRFLTKNVNEFHKINLNELKNIEIIDDDKIHINIKNNDNIFEVFGVGIEDDIK